MGKKTEPMSESYFYILLCLAAGPLHGYGIMQRADALSDGAVRIGSGTMYGAMENLMKKGWIEEVEETGRKRMYQLTEAGREALLKEVGRLRMMLDAAVRELGSEVER